MISLTHVSRLLFFIIFSLHNERVRGVGVIELDPLTCNNDIDLLDCTKTPLSSLVDGAGNDEVKIPCGTCYFVDYDDGSTVEMPEGLTIEGKLYFSQTASVTIRTTHIFVTGKLKIDEPSPGNKVRFLLYGTEDKYIQPIGNNEGKCGDAGCKVGKKPFAVAGGQLDIRGVEDIECSSWGKLADFQNGMIQVSKETCWNVDDTIVFTTPDWKIEHSWEAKIVKIENFNITVDLPLPAYFTHATLKTAPDYAVEVASLSRKIIFEGEDDEDLIGGHMIIYHTPNVIQRIEGAEFVNFGQQGNLGRYPIHFHMSQNVTGSSVSGNVIRESNQRGIVIHGSMNVNITHNVAYNIFGHCFFTEDGIETGNSFTHNLGVNIRKPSKVIPGENDNQPSVFWITNPQNSWVNNVAAGSEHSGFWFDTRNGVRGPSRDLPEGQTMKPTALSITKFANNTAHGCKDAGMKYYHPGWRPEMKNDLNTLYNSSVYRNLQMGHFIHANWQIVFDGGLVADNGIGLRIFQVDDIVIKNMNIKGRTDSYKAVMENVTPISVLECRTGFQIQHERMGVLNTFGLEVSNIHFSDFGPECDEAIGINTHFIEFGTHQYESSDGLSNIFFDDSSISKRINLCPAMEMNLDNVAVNDKDGSLDPQKNGKQGFVISNQPKNLAFLDSCTIIEDACAYFCETVCLRNVWVAVNGALTPLQDIEMVIVNSEGTEAVAQARRHDFSDMESAKNYEFYFKAYFGASLPEDDYTFHFRSKGTGDLVWPDFADITYEFPPRDCGGYLNDNSITFNMPEFSVTRCVGELLDDTDFEDIYKGGWQAEKLDLESNEDSDPRGLRATRKSTISSDEEAFLSQYIDRSCLYELAIMEFEARFQFESSGNRQEVLCDDCLKAKIEFQDDDDPRTQHSFLIGTITEFKDGYYHMNGSLPFETYSNHLQKRVMLKIEHNLLGIDFIMFSPRLELKDGYVSPTSSPTKVTDTQQPTRESENVNLALNKLSYQTTTAGNYVAANGNDGDLSTFIHTGNEYRSGRDDMWTVDLDVTASINRIKIYNRQDSAEWRLNNTLVSIHNTDLDIVASENIIFDVENQLELEFDFNHIVGRFVRITHSTSDDKSYLHFAELEVYGSILAQLPTALPSTSPSDSPTYEVPTLEIPSNSPSEPLSEPPSIAPSDGPEEFELVFQEGFEEQEINYFPQNDKITSDFHNSGSKSAVLLRKERFTSYPIPVTGSLIKKISFFVMGENLGRRNGFSVYTQFNGKRKWERRELCSEESCINDDWSLFTMETAFSIEGVKTMRLQLRSIGKNEQDTKIYFDDVRVFGTSPKQAIIIEEDFEDNISSIFRLKNKKRRKRSGPNQTSGLWVYMLTSTSQLVYRRFHNMIHYSQLELSFYYFLNKELENEDSLKVQVSFKNFIEKNNDKWETIEEIKSGDSCGKGSWCVKSIIFNVGGVDKAMKLRFKAGLGETKKVYLDHIIVKEFDASGRML